MRCGAQLRHRSHRTAWVSAAHVETSTSTTFAILKPLFRIKNDTCLQIQISFGSSSHMAPSSSTSFAHQMLFCSRVNIRNFSTTSSSIWPARFLPFCAQNTHTHTDEMARQPIIVMILSNEIQSLFSISRRFKVALHTYSSLNFLLSVRSGSDPSELVYVCINAYPGSPLDKYVIITIIGMACVACAVRRCAFRSCAR